MNCSMVTEKLAGSTRPSRTNVLIWALISAVMIVLIPLAFWLGTLEVAAHLIGVNMQATVRFAAAAAMLPFLLLAWGLTCASIQDRAAVAFSYR